MKYDAQRFGVGRLTAEADIAVGTDHIQTGTPGAIAMMQLAPRIQEYLAFAGQVLGQLVRDDQVRFDAAGWARTVASARACSRWCVSAVASAPANSTTWCVVPRNLWKNRTGSRPG